MRLCQRRDGGQTGLGPGQDTGAAFVLVPIAIARDLNNGGVISDAVEHGRCQYGIAGKGLIPATEGQVRRQDQRSFFKATRNHLEEQVRLLAMPHQGGAA